MSECETKRKRVVKRERDTHRESERGREREGGRGRERKQFSNSETDIWYSNKMPDKHARNAY